MCACICVCVHAHLCVCLFLLLSPYTSSLLILSPLISTLSHPFIPSLPLSSLAPCPLPLSSLLSSLSPPLPLSSPCLPSLLPLSFSPLTQFPGFIVGTSNIAVLKFNSFHTSMSCPEFHSPFPVCLCVLCVFVLFHTWLGNGVHYYVQF